MTLEIRPIKAREKEAFNRNVRTAFAIQEEHDLKIPLEWTLCAFEDGRLATSYMAWPLTMQFAGATIPVAGVSMVGTFPTHRRRGHLRKVTEKHFKQLYRRGERPISALFASMAAIYQRYGYGIVSFKNSYTFEPRHLQFSDARPVAGNFWEAGDKEKGTMLDLYRRFSKDKVGYLQRNEAMEVAPGAPMTVLAFPRTPMPLIKVIYWEEGEPLGYIIYHVENDNRPGMGQRLVIRDIVWLAASAYRAIWDYLANMDLVGEISWGWIPPDDPLPHLLLEPRMLKVTSSDGLLARIVDVEKALAMRPYSEEGALTFEIIDDLCPWNSGRWKLETSAAGTNMSKTREEPQLTMPVSTLTMLMFGQISASEAARMARLDVHDNNALALWDKVMRTPYRPFCADIF